MILSALQAGTGKPVVLLHGLFGRAQNLGAVARHLAGRYRVISLDLRNHGASPHASSMEYAAMAGDVVETLASLDALPAAVLGHSMGGKVAMAVALIRPALVSRLVVADIAPVHCAHGNQTVAAAMQGLKLDAALSRAQAYARLETAVPDPAVRQFLLQNLIPGAAPAWRLGLAHIVQAIAVIEGFPDFPLGAVYAGPSLFVRGAQSDYVRPEHHQRIQALFPNVQIVSLKNAGHWLHTDQPAAFIRAVDEFLGNSG
jgi:pimeloyl-ACP methyl ester carboxylesterase